MSTELLEERQTKTFIAVLFCVSEKTVRDWTKAGILKPKDKLYHVADAVRSGAYTDTSGNS
jgi:hypothetical protein